MERIEISCEVIYKSKDNIKFATESECVRYEALLDKYSSVYATIEDGDGAINHFFYVNSNEEAEECVELFGMRHHHYVHIDITRDYSNKLIWIPYDLRYDYDDSIRFLETIDDFIKSQEEVAEACDRAVEAATSLINKFAKQRKEFAIATNIIPRISDTAINGYNYEVEIYKCAGSERELIHRSICPSYPAALATIDQYVRLSYFDMKRGI